jgi:acyl-coenzyme A synthetase/AMP-(fatty) acid ligase
LSTMLGYMNAFSSLLWGAPFFSASSYKEVINLIDAYQIECLSGSPKQLAGLIEEIQRTSKRLTSLAMVWYGGGEASPSLLNSMRRDLCSNVVCRYGSAEAGGVSMSSVHDPKRQRGMAGYVLPEVDVQIVDADHNSVGINEEGAIRIKTPSMVKGYLNNAVETNRSFRDGWFYPGDRGKLLENGFLILSGREDELLNLGGVKVDPVTIDYCIQEYDGVRDAAAFAFENHLGLEVFCVAIVVDKGFDINGLRKHLIHNLGREYNPSVFMCLKEIPRNQMGKPLRKQMRDQLGDDLRHQLRQQASPARSS